MTANERLVRDLTSLYIKWHTSKIAADSIRDALIRAQKDLSMPEKEKYETWHKKKWPNLDW